MDEMLNSKEYAEELRRMRGASEDDDPLGDGDGGGGQDPLRLFIKRVTEGRPWPANGEEGEAPVDQSNVNDLQVGVPFFLFYLHHTFLSTGNDYYVLLRHSVSYEGSCRLSPASPRV
jgi:hypothetical protein